MHYHSFLEAFLAEPGLQPYSPALIFGPGSIIESASRRHQPYTLHCAVLPATCDPHIMWALHASLPLTKTTPRQVKHNQEVQDRHCPHWTETVSHGIHRLQF
jgi:hypothetical protein